MGVHLSALIKLPEIISESVEAEVHPDYVTRDVFGEINTERLIHRFYGATMIEGKTYRVKTTMQEFRGKDATTPHSFEVVHPDRCREQ